MSSPAYYKFTEAITGGAWVYGAAGEALYWAPWCQIEAMGLKPKEERG